MTIRIPNLICAIVSIGLLFFGHSFAARDSIIFQDDSQEHVRARVQSITERLQPWEDLEPFDEHDDFFFAMIGEKLIFEAEVRTGPLRGEIVSAEQGLSDFFLIPPTEVVPGDLVLLINFGDGWRFNGHMRTNRLLVLGILFGLCILFFGGRKGFNTLLSLGLTCAAVFAVFIPAILSGRNIYVMALLLCSYTTIMTLILVMGYNKKSLAAALGCLGGIMTAAIIVLIMNRALHITGILDPESRQLLNLPIEPPINLKALIFGGVIIGAMGAIMDVAMSISSSLWEIKEKAPRITFETLFRSGLNIGRDIMGSMANTLILAYIGSSLSVVLVLTVYSNSLMELLNWEMILVEIVQALAGSFGILFALPLTAFFSALFFLTKETSRD